MKIKVMLLVILIMFTSGCFFDAYKDQKFGKLVIETWFSEKKDDLGKKRKEIEKIDEIKEISCKYKETYKEYYVFKCNINYTLAGTTKIPLSSYKDMELYALFKPHGNTFDYRVYNSSYKDGVWTLDESL